ncbi:hypothetical protein BDV97DRAFT_366334 [Delphinella strobiligena]|nr:hypothetical protein BDV97DRAFT_366334 [Delphinella strobiligena]
MPSNPPHHSTPSTTSTPPATNPNTTKAKAPDGKYYTFAHRQKLDRDATTKAVLDVQKHHLYREASLEDQREMRRRAGRDGEEKRKGRGRHVSCLFDEGGVPLVQAGPAVKNVKGGLRYQYAQTGYGVEDDFGGLEQLEEEDGYDDDGDEDLVDEEDETESEEDETESEEDETESEEDETESEEDEEDEADDSHDSDAATGPATSTSRSYAYPANPLYHIYLLDSRRLDRLDLPAAPNPHPSASLPPCPLATMTARVDMRVGRAWGYSDMNSLYHMYLPGGRRLDNLTETGLDLP